MSLRKPRTRVPTSKNWHGESKKNPEKKKIDVEFEEPVEALNQPSELQGRDPRVDACSALAG